MKFCSKCGQEVHEQAVVCVHCGCPIEGAAVANANKKYSAMSITGFILSLISIYFSIYGAVAVAGIIFSAIGIKRCETGAFKGGGMAVAGLVISIISLVLILTSLIFAGTLLGAMSSFLRR